MTTIHEIRSHLLAGQAIPALPLALDRRKCWSERRQRAVIRYYLEAGVGGIAVGVHSTQFAIRDPRHSLYEPLLSLAAETIDRSLESSPRPLLRIAGLCGRTSQALSEAALASRYRFNAGLLSLGAWKNDSEGAILRHCIRIGASIPLIGFYLQPSVGGRVLSYEFWRKFAEIPTVVAVKVAPFNRYQTLDVVRAIMDAGREDIALYTGNDDNILCDLLTTFAHGGKKRRIVGGLLGQWGVWTERAVALFKEVKRLDAGVKLDSAWLTRNAALTDANGAVFDAANGYAGCVPGINEVLRRQGLFESTTCLDPHERLSPGQTGELDRVTAAYPWLVDDTFVQENLHRWLA